MRTIHHTRTADGITIRLIERAIKPYFVITQHTRSFGNFQALGNDRQQAIQVWIDAVEYANTHVLKGRAG